VISFKREFDLFIAMQQSLMAQYISKILAIKGQQVVGGYQDALEMKPILYLKTQKNIVNLELK
jgi:hypothetical protein